MKIISMTIGLKRDVRHARYNVSQCHIQFTAQLNSEDDPVQAYAELYDDVEYALDEAVKKEKQIYQESLNAIKNK